MLEKMNDLDQLAAVAADAAEYTQIIEKLLAFLMAAHINPSMMKYQSVIQKALGFIKENFTDPDISLNVVADAVNLSPSHFSTIFSQSLGQTFID
ncbi:MAG: AraC family transcriptional regulator, partial [Trichococcus flocculiformis]